MPEEEKMDLLVMIEKNPSGRKHKRLFFSTIIDYSVDARFYKDFIRNISEGGIFVETKTPIPIGKDIQVTFLTPKENQAVKIDGTIIRVSSNGFGVKFKESVEMEKVLNL